MCCVFIVCKVSACNASGKSLDIFEGMSNVISKSKLSHGGLSRKKAGYGTPVGITSESPSILNPKDCGILALDQGSPNFFTWGQN